MLMIYDELTEETVDIDTKIVNVEECEGTVTVYFEPVEDKVYYFTMTKEEFELVKNPTKV